MINTKLLDKDIYSITITNKNNNSASFSNYGALLLSLIINDKNNISRDVILGYKNIDEYKDNHPMFGAIIGRNIGRISNAAFVIDGIRYELVKNRGKHNIHSDKINGFNKNIWDYEIVSDYSVKFSYIDENLKIGFPGNLKTEVTYTFNDKDELCIDIVAVCDAKTIINISNHNYFNLNGIDNGNILNHEFSIDSNSVTEVDDEIIPNGKFIDVKNTFLDLNEERKLNIEDAKQFHGYDYNYVINDFNGKMKHVASSYSEKTGIRMDASANLMGLQFYTSNTLNEQNGKPENGYTKYDGFCFEPQYFPNNVNVPSFPKSIFDKNEKFISNCKYSFFVK